MRADEAKEPIKIYLDEEQEPFKVAHPPLRFSFSTIHLADGPHILRVEASNGLAPPTIKEIPFRVRNGVAVTVSGLEEGQTIGGQVELIVNAYAGNTEVDFEPRRAETPQPIPTWAWVLLLAIGAWTLFYVFNPARPPRDASASTFEIGRTVGERIYMDTCARCHGEHGDGRLRQGSHSDYIVKKLRDTPNLAVAETPYRLLFKVVTGIDSSGPISMPAWGPRLTNEEIVAVVNYVRSSWGHDASKIEPTYRRPPPGIDDLEANIVDAMVTKDADAMATCCWPQGVRPQLYRIDGPRRAIGRAQVLDEWRGYFEALGKGKILDFQLTDVRYAYQPEAVDNAGAYVFAMGRIFLSTLTGTGRKESDTGRFIRVYRRVAKRDAKGKPTGGTQWALVFDFASIRMRVGCAVSEGGEGPGPECPPGTEESAGGTTPTPQPAKVVGYSQIQALLRGLKKDPGDAGHERFWDLPYKKFVGLDFPYSWDDPDKKVRLLVPGNSKDSNIIKALTDGKNVEVRDETTGKVRRVDIPRMPKGGKPMAAKGIATIAAWIDAGCPEFAPGAGGPKAAPKDTTPKGTAPPGGPGGSTTAPGGSGPGGTKPAAGTIGYAEVQQIFRAVHRDPGDAPHERFWELPYKEFVDLVFPFSWDSPEVKVKLLEPWDAADSNMIHALRGESIAVELESGRVVHKNIARMPKGGKPMAPEDIAKLAAWIDAGCPELAGKPSALPKPGAAPGPAKDEEAPPKKEAAPPKKDAAPPKKEEAPKGAQPSKGESPKPPPAAAPTSPAVSDLGFEQVRDILRKLHLKAPNAPHGNFWRELGYDEFVHFEFPEGPGKPGRIRLLVPWDSKDSNLVKAFRDGKGIRVRMPDGTVVTKDIPPMPKDADPIPRPTLERLAAWIDAGCPEFAGKPSALPKPGAAQPPAPPAKKPAAPPAPSDGFPAPAPHGR
jgi:mono/diheme cytochrome c family protein